MIRGVCTAVAMIALSIFPASFTTVGFHVVERAGGLPMLGAALGGGVEAVFGALLLLLIWQRRLPGFSNFSRESTRGGSEFGLIRSLTGKLIAELVKRENEPWPI